MSRSIAFLIIVLGLIGSLSNCASFLESTSQVKPIEPDASLSILFQGANNPSFRDHLASAFIRKGFTVRIIEPYALLGPDLDRALRPYGEYSVIPTIANSLAGSTAGEVSGDRELIEEIVGSNDIVESTNRLRALSDFYSAIGEYAEVDYVLLVDQRDGFNEMAIQLVDLRSREIVMTYFLQADAQGIDNNIQPYEGPGLVDMQSSVDIRATRRSIDVAEYVVGRMTS